MSGLRGLSLGWGCCTQNWCQVLGPLWKQEAARRCGTGGRGGGWAPRRFTFFPLRKQLGCTSGEAIPARREAPVLSAVQGPTALASVYPPAWPERGKNWKTKAPRPQALPAEAWGRQARGGRLRGREGGVATAPEHKNNEARGAVGPSRLVPESLSDLDRCHSWAPGEEPPPPRRGRAAQNPPTSPRPGSMAAQAAQPQAAPPPGRSQERFPVGG